MILLCEFVLGFGNTAVQPKLSSMTLNDFQTAAAGKAEQVKSWSVRAFKVSLMCSVYRYEQRIFFRSAVGTLTVFLICW